MEWKEKKEKEKWYDQEAYCLILISFSISASVNLRPVGRGLCKYWERGKVDWKRPRKVILRINGERDRLEEVNHSMRGRDGNFLKSFFLFDFAGIWCTWVFIVSVTPIVWRKVMCRLAFRRQSCLSNVPINMLTQLLVLLLVTLYSNVWSPSLRFHQKW